MIAPHEQAIVVGVDGSQAALRAVRWAALAAKRQQAVLRLLTAVDPATRGGGPEAVGHTLGPDLTTMVNDRLSAARATAEEIAPRILVESGIRGGTAASVLVIESAHARLLVLGHRAPGEPRSRLSRSVAVPIALHTACPAVIVRGRAEDDSALASAPVVVGVDGSPGSVAALGFAFDTAARRGVVLVAVHAWSDNGRPSVLVGASWHQVGMRERDLLDERVAVWSATYPQVHVTTLLFHDRPAWALTEQSRDAQLVVLGSFGRRGFRARRLGAVTRSLLRRAECPVAIIRQ